MVLVLHSCAVRVCVSGLLGACAADLGARLRVLLFLDISSPGAKGDLRVAALPGHSGGHGGSGDDEDTRNRALDAEHFDESFLLPSS